MLLLKNYLILLFVLHLNLYATDAQVYESVQGIIEKEVPSQDVDSDGILDYIDKCPDTFLNTAVSNTGCPQSSLIVLLPNNKKNNAIIVENEMGSVEVDKPYNYVKINSQDEEPTQPEKMYKYEIDGMFPFINENKYKKATHYTLYFNGTTLKRSSKIKLKTIENDIKSRLNPVISIYGHTDTVGSKSINFDIGKKRAHKVKTILDRKNLKYFKINIKSMGEMDLKVKTKDEVLEPRNKRVEILIQ